MRKIMAEKRKTAVELINSHSEQELPSTLLVVLAEKVIEREKINLSTLSIMLVNDEYLRKLHRQFLRDDSFTDVMTFEWDDDGRESEIYISLERAKINAREYNVPMEEELARLIIHGLLHLKGLDDNTAEQREKMHQRENKLLDLFWEKI
ncbi:MAG: rRNA maturation RNase YbeY [Calditrichaeota bacterium]|nr:rRNA maturation RNase YbeY [Calditrichota bacterium]RQW03295.1 MAG: rRNA maturation RNase YbeY [Calditrichota bacterium]